MNCSIIRLPYLALFECENCFGFCRQTTFPCCRLFLAGAFELFIGRQFRVFFEEIWRMRWFRFNSMAFKLESWFRLMNFINTLASWMYFFTVRPKFFFLNFLRIFISKCLKKIKFCICSYIKTPIPKFTKFCI